MLQSSYLTLSIFSLFSTFRDWLWKKGLESGRLLQEEWKRSILGTVNPIAFIDPIAPSVRKWDSITDYNSVLGRRRFGKVLVLAANVNLRMFSPTQALEPRLGNLSFIRFGIVFDDFFQ